MTCDSDIVGVREIINISHIVERFSEDGGQMLSSHEEGLLRVPLLRQSNSHWNSNNKGEAELRGGQVEAFLVGLGVALPSVLRAEASREKASSLGNELVLERKLNSTMLQQREDWKAYAQRLERCVAAYSSRALKLQQRKRPSA